MMDLPELRTIDLEGPVAYREWDGPADSAFVLVHGLGASHLSWIQVAEGLSGLGRVFATRPSRVRGVAARRPKRRPDGSAPNAVAVHRDVGRRTGRVGGELDGGSAFDPRGRGRTFIRERARLNEQRVPLEVRRDPAPAHLGFVRDLCDPGIGERFVSWRLHQMDPSRR